MGFLQQRGQWSGPLTLQSPELARLWGAPPSSTGVGVNETTALTYSAFWACVNAISTDCASLPLIHYKRIKGGGKERFTESKLYRLLHDEPNREMTALTFRQTLTAHALTWGGGYAEIQRAQDRQPFALWPLTPDRVTPYREERGEIAYRVMRVDGSYDVIASADMLHIPGLGFDGLCGYSVVAKARESIGLGLATERFGGTFFGGGSTFGGVISTVAPLTEAAEKNFREKVQGAHQGVERAHKFLLLGGGAKYERLGIPPNDAQFLETRLHQVEEMCRWFRMPPHKIQHLLRSTNNNIEHQGIEYYTDTLRPWLVRWEQEILRKLIHQSEQRIQFAEHLIDGVLRGDLPSRYAAYAIGRNWGWLSADDVRERENMNPLPGGQGQIYLLPQNMAPANRLNDIIDKQVEPTPKPVAAAPAADPNAPEAKSAREAIEAIGAALVQAEERVAGHLAAAAAADADAERWKESAGTFQADADAERAKAADATQERATLKALLLEAEERSIRERADLEAATTAAEAERERRVLAVADAAAVAQQRDQAEQAVELARAAVVEAEQRAAASQAAAAEERTAWGTAVRDTEAATHERDVALADLHIAREAVRDAEIGAAHVAANLAEAKTRATGIEDELATVRDAATKRATAAERHLIDVAVALKAVVVDRLAGMIELESDRARAKHGSPEKLRKWIEDFYGGDCGDRCRAILRPSVKAWIVCTNHPEPVEHLLDVLVSQHLEQSVRQLHAVANESDAESLAPALEKLLRRWEASRAETLADRVLKDVA